MNSNIRKAVIPIAGLGTRHFPASHAVKKEMFPVVGPDGIARALFHYHLLELEAAGIEEICIITQPGEDELLKVYMRGPVDNYVKRIEKYQAMLREDEQMRGFARRVSFRRAASAGRLRSRGFSDERFCGGRNGFARTRRSSVSRQRWPVRLALAVSRTRGHGQGFRRQKRFRREPHLRRGIEGATARSPANRAARRKPGRLIDISAHHRKSPPWPSRRRSCRVDGLPAGTWLGWFGMHLLAPSHLRHPTRK